MAKLSGQAKVLADGLSFRMKEAEIDIGGHEREMQMADFAIAGYTEKPVPAVVTGTGVHDSQTDLIKAREITNATIVFVTDTGVKYTVRGAVCSKSIKLKSAGEVDYEFTGQPALQS